jgi:hypothetical protein
MIVFEFSTPMLSFRCTSAPYACALHAQHQCVGDTRVQVTSFGTSTLPVSKMPEHSAKLWVFGYFRCRFVVRLSLCLKHETSVKSDCQDDCTGSHSRFSAPMQCSTGEACIDMGTGVTSSAKCIYCGECAHSGSAIPPASVPLASLYLAQNVTSQLLRRRLPRLPTFTHV